jgi:hypothetical protein
MAEQTIEQKLTDYLINSGMFQHQAEAVMEAVKKLQPSMDGRWSEPPSAYPVALYIGLQITARTAALEWIDANLPDAWFRGMFEPTVHAI